MVPLKTRKREQTRRHRRELCIAQLLRATSTRAPPGLTGSHSRYVVSNAPHPCPTCSVARHLAIAFFARRSARVRPRRIDQRRHRSTVRRCDPSFLCVPPATQGRLTAHGRADPGDDGIAAVDAAAARDHRQDHSRRSGWRARSQLYLSRAAGRVRTRIRSQDHADCSGESPRELARPPSRMASFS